MTTKPSAANDLRLLLEKGDEAFDLAEAALLLAASNSPSAELEPYRTHLAALYTSVREQAEHDGLDNRTATPEQMAAVLAHVIGDEFRYRGDEQTYDDLDNANLMRVIDRRKGLPVSLGILYIAAAAAQQWNVSGLNFPGHFLIRLEGLDGSRAIIDPFHAGQVLETPALRDLLKVVAGPAEELDSRHYKTVTYRDILLRLQNNVKTRRLDMGQMSEALEALETMQVLMPDSAALFREAGLLNLRLGQLSQALDSLETYLSRAPAGPERSRIDTVVQDLKQRIH